MTDYERGPYTPQTDAPLAFDARRSRDGRRPFPVTLIVSLVILVVLIGAVVMFYRSGVRSAAEGPVAVGTPVGQIKAPAPAQSQPSDEAAGLQIYKSEAGTSAPQAAPGFAPPPEEPKARPTPPVQAQALPSQAVASAPVNAVPSTPAPSVVAASGATSKSTPAAPAKPAPVAAAKTGAPAAPRDEVASLLDKSPAAPAKATPAPAAAPAAGGAVAQIGAYSSNDLAAKGWTDLAQAFPGDMAGKGKHFEPVVAADGKTLFRAAVTGFGSKTDAQAFCAKLKAAGHACIVK
jgi:hypothetical protein